MSGRPAPLPRRIALDALLRIEDGAFAHILVPRALRSSGLPARDRALVTDLVYGTVRMQRRLDVMVSAVSNRAIGSVDAPVRAALRLGAYQLLIGVPAHAAVGETVGVVDARARGFVNGVLRTLARAGPPWPLPDGDEVAAVGVRTSHPDWIVRTLVDAYGMHDAIATLELDNEAPPVTLRVNPLRTWRRQQLPPVFEVSAVPITLRNRQLSTESGSKPVARFWRKTTNSVIAYANVTR